MPCASCSQRATSNLIFSPETTSQMMGNLSELARSVRFKFKMSPLLFIYPTCKNCICRCMSWCQLLYQVDATFGAYFAPKQQFGANILVWIFWCRDFDAEILTETFGMSLVCLNSRNLIAVGIHIGVNLMGISIQILLYISTLHQLCLFCSLGDHVLMNSPQDGPRM